MTLIYYQILRKLFVFLVKNVHQELSIKYYILGVCATV